MRPGRKHRFETGNELAPQPDTRLGQSRAHRPLERDDISVLGRQANLEPNRTVHLEPLQALVLRQHRQRDGWGTPRSAPVSTDVGMLTILPRPIDGMKA